MAIRQDTVLKEFRNGPPALIFVDGRAGGINSRKYLRV